MVIADGLACARLDRRATGVSMDDHRALGRILVVDDDENVLRLLAIKLKRAGATVDLAPDLQTALAAARAAPPDLVVAGDALPDGDAGTLVRALANSAAPAGGRTGPGVVCLSARDAAEDIGRALDNGADDYVLKPFSPHELIHRLRVVQLRRRAAARQQG